MEANLTQVALVPEVTQGTTPAIPGFLLTRDTRVGGSPDRPATRSPERRADRRAANMYQGVVAFNKTIEMVWSRDAATDVLVESLMNNTFAADVVNDGATKRFFSLEQKYEGGATDPYRRLLGCQVDSLQFGWRIGEPASCSWSIMALDESTATTAIAGATYAAPTPYLDPVTPIDFTATTLFGITGAKITEFNMSITNSLRPQYQFGSFKPWGLGLGAFDVSGSVKFYFSQLSDYSTFTTRQTGQTLDVTFGATTLQKDKIQMLNVDVWNPDVDDGGNNTDHMTTLNFMGRYYATNTNVIRWTRKVA